MEGSQNRRHGFVSMLCVQDNPEVKTKHHDVVGGERKSGGVLKIMVIMSKYKHRVDTTDFQYRNDYMGT